MGDFAKAEQHLKQFNGKGTMVALVAKGALGDAYMEQNKIDDAIKAYLDASIDDNNILLTPVYLERAGMAYEMQNKKADAIKVYKQINDKFPTSPQSQNIKKSLARLGEYN